MKISELEDEDNWWQSSLTLFVKLSTWVAVPVILALFIGRWLDEKYNTTPWLLLLSVGIVSLVSLFGIIKETAKAMREIDNKQDKKDNKSIEK